MNETNATFGAIWFLSCLVGWVGILLMLAGRGRIARILLLSSIGVGVVCGTLATMTASEKITVSSPRIPDPLNKLPFGPEEVPSGYQLAPFDLELAEILTGNPGYRLGSEDVVAVYQKANALLYLHFGPDHDAKWRLENLQNTGLTEREARFVLPVTYAWNSSFNFTMIAYYMNRGDVDAAEFESTQMTVQKLAHRLGLYATNLPYSNQQETRAQ